MPKLSYDLIANLLSHSQARHFRILPDGGMVVVSGDGVRLRFTDDDVTKAELLQPIKLPRVESRPTPEVIIQPTPVTRRGESKTHPVRKGKP
jgi:hypothetical protein